MGSRTGIELGGDSCVVVRVRPGDEAIRLMALGGTLSPGWDLAEPLADNLRRARRSGRFPKHADVVSWDLHESASASDPLTRALLAPLRDAGFAVDTVLSPTDALCALAKRRQKTAGREGEVWLALNRQHVAMAIVEDGRLLYSRRFDWHYSPGATQRAELLQRYSLVAHLAPEVRHGIDVVRAEHGVRVNAVVTCGDLPDLRSLTMPLIEELDIEVETLDTLDGIAVEGAAAGDAVADQAPAIRLACAAAAGSAASGSERWRLVAAAVVLLAILTGAWMLMRSLSGSRTDRGSQQARQPTTAPVSASRPAAATTRETASVTPPLAQSSGTANAPATGRPAPAPRSARIVGIARGDHRTDTAVARACAGTSRSASRAAVESIAGRQLDPGRPGSAAGGPRRRNRSGRGRRRTSGVDPDRTPGGGAARAVGP